MSTGCRDGGRRDSCDLWNAREEASTALAESRGGLRAGHAIGRYASTGRKSFWRGYEEILGGKVVLGAMVENRSLQVKPEVRNLGT
jgi:hypothetical protein